MCFSDYSIVAHSGGGTNGDGHIEGAKFFLKMNLQVASIFVGCNSQPFRAKTLYVCWYQQLDCYGCGFQNTSSDGDGNFHTLMGYGSE